jgi:hypothetical protein
MSDGLEVFVKEALTSGLSRDAIRDVLLRAGWREDDVNNALSAFADIDFPVPVPKPKPYVQARQAFMYVVSFVALFITAFSIGTLIFGYIDLAFPDPLSFSSQYRGDTVPDELTWAIAAVIVTFPLYLLLMWRLAKDAELHPEFRQSRIWKWLTYLTLAVAAAVIIGDLIVLLSNVLRGDLTVPFIFKVLTVLLITGAVFGYYLWDLKRTEKVNDLQPQPINASLASKALLASAILAAVLTVGYGIYVAGSPGQQRMERLDALRASHLESIVHQVNDHWRQTGSLPDSLESLRRQPREFDDPETDVPYEYRVIDDANFEICAVFATDTTGQNEWQGPVHAPNVRRHGVGLTCFEFEALPLEPVKPVPDRPTPATVEPGTPQR